MLSSPASNRKAFPASLAPSAASIRAAKAAAIAAEAAENAPAESGAASDAPTSASRRSVRFPASKPVVPSSSSSSSDGDDDDHDDDDGDDEDADGAARAGGRRSTRQRQADTNAGGGGGGGMSSKSAADSEGTRASKRARAPGVTAPASLSDSETQTGQPRASRHKAGQTGADVASAPTRASKRRAPTMNDSAQNLDSVPPAVTAAAQPSKRSRRDVSDCLLYTSPSPRD